MIEKSNLIETWRKCDLNKPPYRYPEDPLERMTGMYSVIRSFDEYIDREDFGKRYDTRFHLGLMPVPYVGNLAHATIYILMLNPGFAPADYFVEQHFPEFREQIKRNLFQEIEEDDYPFFALHPRHSWTGAYDYWAGKLSSVLQEIIKQKGISPQAASSLLSRNIACLELFPYHSRSFGAGKLMEVLPSVMAMKDFVKRVLVPKVENGEAVIIVTRVARQWDLPKHDRIIQYEGSEARAAHLTASSRGGGAILRQLGLEVATP